MQTQIAKPLPSRRGVVVGGAAGLMSLLCSRGWAGDASVQDAWLAAVDPALRPPMRKMLQQGVAGGPPPSTSAAIAKGRQMMAAFSTPPSSAVGWKKVVIAGAQGAPPVTIYVVNARQGGPARPAILHTHGGATSPAPRRNPSPRCRVSLPRSTAWS